MEVDEAASILSEMKCDLNADFARALEAELIGAMSGGGKRRRLRGGMRIVDTVKSLMAALCTAGSTAMDEITDYPLTKMQGIADSLNLMKQATPEGRAAKAAFGERVRTALKTSVGGLALADLSSPQSRIVRLATVILRVLEDVFPRVFHSLDRIPTLASNLAIIGANAAPVIGSALVTAAATWAIRMVYRRLVKPSAERAAAIAIVSRDFLLSDASVDAVVDHVIGQVPQLAEMALQAGRGAVRATGTVWAGRLRSARIEAASVAGAIGALGGRGAAVAALEAGGEEHSLAEAEVAELLADMPGGRRRRTRKHRKNHKKRTLRRKY